MTSGKTTGTRPENAVSMRWHKFLIYFGLWVSAVMNIGQAGEYAGGLIYGEMAAQFYATYPGISVLDKFWSAFLMCMAALAIAVRFALARKKKIGPKMLCAVYLLNIVMTNVYLIICTSLLGVGIGGIFNTSYFISMIAYAVMLAVNYKYYKNREGMFGE